ncbi:MAG: response regulator [Acidobacteriota bacterium]
MTAAILVVDDEAANRRATARILRAAGFSVREAATGDEALREAESQPPDLVVLDVHLPDITGIEVCRRLKATPVTSGVPVLHLTATAGGVRERVRGLEEGADGYLVEPVEPEELVATVRSLLRVRQAETRLRESEERYRDLVENASDLIMTHDLEGRLLSVNAAGARAVGATAGDLLRRNLRDIVAPEFRADVDRYLETVRRGGRAEGIMKVLDPDGGPRYLEYRNTMRTEGVPTPLVRCVARDVTREVFSTQALRESERRYRELFEAHPIPMWIYDLEYLRFLAVNDAAVQAYGWSREEFLAMTVRDIRPADDLERFDSHIGAVRRIPRIFHPPEVWRHRRKDGSVVEVEVTAHSVRFEGRPARVITAQDLTERRRLEAQLLHAQKMEAIGLLAGGVAHDFNNLLQGMTSLISAGRAEGELPARAASRYAELDEIIARGAALTRQLLLFARRDTVRPETVDLADVVRRTAGILRRLLRENIAFSVAAAGPQWVEIDRGQLEQVLVNLTVNASEAMPDGGDLSIRVPENGREWASLEVADTGHGIPEAVRERIFEPFFTTKSPGKGTGLGLSVVHGIVTRQGGRITVSGRSGGGTTFTVRLPRAAAPIRAASEATGADCLARGRGERILVVEDDQVTRESLAEVLATLGYAVTTASRIGEAGLLDVGQEPAVLLTDLVLPDGSGLDLALSLVERWPALKVILMSGYTDDETVRLAAGGGQARYLQKPFGIDRLAGELRAALDSP